MGSPRLDSRTPRGVLDVIGLGLDPARDLPLGALRTLLAADAMFCLEWPDLYRPFAEELGIQIIDLQSLFDQYPLRHDALREACRRVLEQAAARAGVVFLLGGHPTLACAPATFLGELAPAAGVTLRFFPAVSSFDCLLADIGFDPTDAGVQVVRGSAARNLTPAMPAVVLCPGYAEDTSPSRRIREIAGLVASLGRVYGTAARFIIYSRKSEATELRAIDLLGLLEDLASRRYLGDVLLIGPEALLPETVKGRAL